MVQKSILLLLITLGFVGLKSQTLTITNPVQYNDYIVGQQSIIGEELLELIEMFKELPEDKTTATDQLKNVLTAAKNGIDSLQKLRPMEAEFGLRKAAINLFQFYEETMDKDYRTIIDQLYLETPDLKVLQEVIARAQTSEAEVDKRFQTAQTAFANHHNIDLQENQLQEKFEGDAQGENEEE
jgi:hypothetical protein